MPLSAQAQAVVLLTAYLANLGRGEARPLSPTEWGRFALWLKEQGLQPEALLSGEPARLLGGWSDKSVTVPRVEALLGRGAALGLALERWERAGLWVLTRSDPDYPDQLKRRLKSHSPPLLFGCGSRQLLGKGGLAVVGSRDAVDSALSFAAMLGAEAAAQGMSVVSGGARGVDEAVMLGALEHEGTTVGVLADSLLRAATSAKYRRYLMARDLVLVSPFNPEAGFEVGNAMARNRYIYCLADAAVVVSSSLEKGGTWTGALENLKEQWVPLWIKPDSHPTSGNAELVRRGARWLPDGRRDLTALSLPAERAAGAGEPLSSPPELPFAPATMRADSVREVSATAHTAGFYELFLRRMEGLAPAGPLTPDQLLACLELSKPQLNTWLKRAIADKRIKKLNKPARYLWQGSPPRQPSMFGDER